MTPEPAYNPPKVSYKAKTAKGQTKLGNCDKDTPQGKEKP
jgi:hypothetical protein